MIAIKSPSEAEICPVVVAGYAGVPRYRKGHPHASIESSVIDTSIYTGDKTVLPSVR
jgi:hypothetical protein